MDASTLARTTKLLVAVDVSGSISSNDLSYFYGVVNSAFRYGFPFDLFVAMKQESGLDSDNEFRKWMDRNGDKREKDGNDRDDSSGLGGKIKAECDQREPGETRGEENADGGASPERQEDFKKGDVGQSMHCRDADLDSEFRDADARHLIVASGDVHAQEEKGERHEGFCEDDESTEPLSAERSGGGRRGMRHCVLAGAEPGHQDSAAGSAGDSSPSAGFLPRGFLT